MNADQVRPESAPPSRASAITTLAILLVFSLALALLLTNRWDQVKEFIQASGYVGVLVSIAIYTILGASPIPSEPLTVINSTISGPAVAMLVAVIGNTLAALMEFFIGHKLSDAASIDRQREKLPFGLGKLPIDSPIFLIFARMLPGYGPKFVSILAGACRVRLWRFTWTTLVTNAFGAAVFAFGGYEVLTQLLGLFK